MRLLAAYIGVVLIWSTTPLAIKWSGEGPGYLFGVTGRMSLGLVCVLLVMAILRQPLPLHRKARLTYWVGALQMYGAMLTVYWSSQFIPSGWMSVVFGLTPLLTALLAAIWLGERSLTPGRLLAYAVGIGGLGTMFGSALELSSGAERGIAGVLLAAFLQALTSVWIKRIDSHVPALALVAGSLIIAVPCYLLTWGLLDGHWPEALPLPSLLSIIYLGTIATTVGFALYFYVLKHLPATRVALITLMTPVMSLWLGYSANGEPIGWRVAAGTALILGALVLHEVSERPPRSPLPARPAPPVRRKKRRVKNRRRSSRGNAP